MRRQRLEASGYETKPPKDGWKTARFSGLDFLDRPFEGRAVIAHHLLAFIFYFLVALIITYPLATHLSTVLTGFVHGDGGEMAQHVWWFDYALQHGQSPFYHSLLGYPGGFPAVTLWSAPLQFFPSWLFAFVLPLPAAINLSILLTLALDGWAMFVLARYLFGGFSVGARRAVPPQTAVRGESRPSLKSGRGGERSEWGWGRILPFSPLVWERGQGVRGRPSPPRSSPGWSSCSFRRCKDTSARDTST